MNPAVTHLPRAVTVYDIGAAVLDQTTGRTVRRLNATKAIRATIQPATGRALDDFPDGIRETARWVMWTMSEVQAGWFVKYGGELYRVDAAWHRHETGHTKAALGKLTDFDGTLDVIDGDDNPVTIGG